MRRGGEAVLVVATRMPLLLVRLARLALGLLWRRRRSRSTFRRVLRREGIDPAVAQRLAALYREQVSVRKLLGVALHEAR